MLLLVFSFHIWFLKQKIAGAFFWPLIFPLKFNPKSSGISYMVNVFYVVNVSIQKNVKSILALCCFGGSLLVLCMNMLLFLNPSI